MSDTPDPRSPTAAAWRLIERREFAAALPQITAACHAAPADPAAHFLRGVCHHALGQLPQALEAFDRAAALDPAHRDARQAAVAVLCHLGQPRQALRRCEELMAAAPDDPDVRFNAGLVHEALGDLVAATRSYGAALARDPKHRPALLNRGLALTRLGRLEDAYANNRVAAEAYPELADSHYNLAEVALAMARHAEALGHCAQALGLDPRHVGALFDRALALSALRRFDEARAAWEAARSVDAPAVDARWASVARRGVAPRFAPETVYLSQAYARMQACDWSEREGFVTTVRELVDRRPEDLPTERALVFASTTLPFAARERLALARAVSAHIQRGVGAPLARRAVAAAPPLRVGYLSPDFRSHAVGRIARSLFAHHDRTAIAVFAYSLAPDDGSDLRHALVAAADRFIDLAAVDDRSAAETIARDGIDVLIDLAGYTDGARQEILALRPAPVQVTWLGFPGSTGADYIDYAFTDRVTTPAGCEAWWSEQLAYLPHTHFPYAAPAEPSPAAREAYGLPREGIVFCAFHSPHKVGPESFAAWLEILRQTPGSVLWLIDSGPACRASLRRAAQATGIAPDRLVEAPREALPRHLGRLALADLFLDTFHYNAVTGACDALWMGVPVLTLTGEAPPARVATSLLHAAALGELAAAEPGEFVALAVRLARAPERLAALRTRVRRARNGAPLFDIRTRVRHVEAAYRQMAERARAGLSPASFDVSGTAAS